MTMKDNPESEVLDLLSELEEEIGAALSSFAGKEQKSIADRYYFNAGQYVFRSVDGYLFLRRGGRIDASKHLIRPAIEAILRVRALLVQPQIFYQIAYSERLDDHRWFRAAAERIGQPYDNDPDPEGWGDFENAFRTEFPNVPLNKAKLSLRDAAKIGGFEGYYDSHYRMYCQYAHAALRAMGGHSDEISDSEDTRAMIMCAYNILHALLSIGADSPKAKSLFARVDDLSKKPNLGLKRASACATTFLPVEK